MRAPHRFALPLLAVVLLMLSTLAACSTLPPDQPATAFEDCFNHPPLYRTQHGCDDTN